MRYFKTSNASRRYTVGKNHFTFEAVEQSGGTWSGVLAIEDDAAADELAGANIPQIEEINQEEYDEVKKKLPTSTPASSATVRPLPGSGQPQQVVEGAAATGATASPDKKAAQRTGALRTSRVEVPDELKTDPGAKALKRGP